jgi:hypothetical protein
MRLVLPAALLLVAAIHLLPLAGVINGSKIASLYGIVVQDPNIEIILRHRAVLFGLLGAFIATAAFRPHLQPLALLAGTVSVAAFLALAFSVGGYNAAIATVVKVDILAALALALVS